MSIALLRALLQDAVQLKVGVAVDVDVGLDTLLSNSKMRLLGVNSDGADTIPVLAVEGYLLLCLEVVGLVLVTTDEDDDVGRQEVDVVALHRGDTENTMEGEVTA